MKISVDVLDTIGDWNPQLYRELKGRLKPHAVGFILAIALLEFPIAFFFAAIRAEEGFFLLFNWVLPSFLWVSGVYGIVSDIGKEKYRETFDFIRLSPQSSQSILSGKLLGAPILIYSIFFLCLPVHFWAGIQANFPIHEIIESYFLWGIIACFFYNMGLLLALSLPNRTAHCRSIAALSSLLTLMASPIFLSLILGYRESPQSIGLRWFFLSFDHQPRLTAIWFLGTLFAINTLIWKIANRHFQNPLQASISKRQSYWITACIQLWLVGFVLPNQYFVDDDVYQFLGCLFLFFIAPLLILLLSVFMSPNRSRLKEWKRYQQFSWRDLFLEEKSPAVGAIALNLGIVLLIWIPWIFLAPFSAASEFSRFQLLAGVVLTFTFLLIYATLIQSIRWFAQTSNQIPLFYFLGIIVVGSPLIFAAAGEILPQELPILWLFSPFPVAGVAYASISAIFLTFASQLSILAFLTQAFYRSLQLASKSELKQLLTHD